MFVFDVCSRLFTECRLSFFPFTSDHLLDAFLGSESWPPDDLPLHHLSLSCLLLGGEPNWIWIGPLYIFWEVSSLRQIDETDGSLHRKETRDTYRVTDGPSILFVQIFWLVPFRPLMCRLSRVGHSSGVDSNVRPTVLNRTTEMTGTYDLWPGSPWRR